MKKIIAMSLVLVMLLSMTASVCAEPVLPDRIEIEQGNEIVPCYNYIKSHTQTLTISGSKATCKATLVGYNGTTTKIVFKITLQKKTLLWWNDVDSYTITYHGYTGSPSRSFTVGSGTYRAKVVYTVYSGSASETITDYSSQKTV